MSQLWESPIYSFRRILGDPILIDVTTSVSPGLGPSSVVVKRLIPFLKKRNVQTVVDFGAGALRHTFPLLKAGFQVCAVEFQEGFARPASSAALEKAQKHPNFSALIWPKEFIQDRRKFDAALLIYVLQVMPAPKEREEVFKQLYRKLRADSCLFYASRYGQLTASDNKHKVSDGFFKWPRRTHHSFYREFTTEETHKMIERHKFTHIRSLSERGTDQMFVYGKGKTTWI